MELKEIHWKPVAEVTFSAREIGVLIGCAMNHYDAKCRETIRENYPAGLLVRMRNTEQNAPGRPHALRFDELDTLGKISEAFRFLEGADLDAALGIGICIRRILVEMNETVPDHKQYSEGHIRTAP